MWVYIYICIYIYTSVIACISIRYNVCAGLNVDSYAYRPYAYYFCKIIRLDAAAAEAVHLKAYCVIWGRLSTMQTRVIFRKRGQFPAALSISFRKISAAGSQTQTMWIQTLQWCHSSTAVVLSNLWANFKWPAHGKLRKFLHYLFKRRKIQSVAYHLTILRKNPAPTTHLNSFKVLKRMAWLAACGSQPIGLQQWIIFTNFSRCF